MNYGDRLLTAWRKLIDAAVQCDESDGVTLSPQDPEAVRLCNAAVEYAKLACVDESLFKLD